MIVTTLSRKLALALAFSGAFAFLGFFSLVNVKEASASNGAQSNLSIDATEGAWDYSWNPGPRTEYTMLVGQSAVLSWYVPDGYSGNMCSASGAWSGLKQSHMDQVHSESTGVINIPGTYVYTMDWCYAIPEGMSESESVTLHVYDYSSLVCKPTNDTLNPGESRIYEFPEPVTSKEMNYNLITVAHQTSLSPITANPPTVEIPLGQNIGGQGINFNTTINTTPGNYILTIYADMTSESGTVRHSCDIQIKINAPPPTVNIECYDYNTGIFGESCSIPYNSNAYINWNATNVNPAGCTVSSNPYDFGYWYSYYDGGSGSGSNYGWTYPRSDTVYTITCTGPGGTTQDTATVDVGTDFAMSCDPSIEITPDIQLNASAAVSVSNYTFNSHAENITLSAEIYPNITNGPTVEFDTNSNPPSQAPDAYPPTLAYINTQQNTVPGDYTVRFTGFSGGKERSCGDIQFTVAAPPPAPPTNIQVNNNVCGQLTISWRPASGTPPTGYRIYRRATNQPGGWSLRNLTITQSNGTFSAVETSPLEPQGYYTVVAYNQYNAESDTQVNETLGVPIRCIPAINALSDIDLVSVTGRISQTFDYEACSGNNDDVAELPSGAVFTPGDRVKFKINVCNSGPGPLVNITIANELSNIIFSEPDSVESDCAEFDGYDSNSLAFTIPNLAAKPANAKASTCSITYIGTVASPSAQGAAIHRFLSEADVVGYDNYGTKYTANIFTPGYLFNAAGREPNRTETAQ